MIRQVQPKIRPGLRRDNETGGDDFKSRLVKMIPAEIVAAYIACNTAITQFGSISLSYWIYWTVFAILIVLMPLYLKRIMHIDDGVQIVIMCFAFIIWCITLEKPFDQLFGGNTKAQQLFATIALTLFTFIIPIFYKGPGGKALPTTSSLQLQE